MLHTHSNRLFNIRVMFHVFTIFYHVSSPSHFASCSSGAAICFSDDVFGATGEGATVDGADGADGAETGATAGAAAAGARLVDWIGWGGLGGWDSWGGWGGWGGWGCWGGWGGSGGSGFTAMGRGVSGGKSWEAVVLAATWAAAAAQFKVRRFSEVCLAIGWFLTHSQVKPFNLSTTCRLQPQVISSWLAELVSLCKVCGCQSAPEPSPDMLSMIYVAWEIIWIIWWMELIWVQHWCPLWTPRQNRFRSDLHVPILLVFLFNCLVHWDLKILMFDDFCYVSQPWILSLSLSHMGSALWHMYLVCRCPISRIYMKPPGSNWKHKRHQTWETNQPTWAYTSTFCCWQFPSLLLESDAVVVVVVAAVD